MNLESPECIICGNNQFSHYLDVKCKESNNSFTLTKCTCSLILTSPRPTSSEIEKYYNIDYLPHSSVNSDTSLFNRIFRKFSYSWKLKLIRNTYENISNRVHMKGSKMSFNMLDIGGGDGSLVFYLKNKISNVHVYEKSIECINHINAMIIAKRINNMYSTEDYKTLEDNYYNIITLFHSLEHVHEVDELFLNINRITKKDAKMIIAVPNVNASEIYFLTNKWVAWDAPRHLYHFNHTTLSLLLDKYGWKIVESKNMFQDTLFNIYMSLEGNSLKKAILFVLLVIYSAIVQIFFTNKQSTNLIICQRK